jgi:hypothetical protein
MQQLDLADAGKRMGQELLITCANFVEISTPKWSTRRQRKSLWMQQRPMMLYILDYLYKFIHLSRKSQKLTPVNGNNRLIFSIESLDKWITQ